MAKFHRHEISKKVNHQKKCSISVVLIDLLFLLGVDNRELLTPPLLPLALALPSLPNPLPLPLPLPLPVGVAQPDTGRDIVNDIRRLPERERVRVCGV